jgi:hypothetical protein
MKGLALARLWRIRTTSSSLRSGALRLTRWFGASAAVLLVCAAAAHADRFHAFMCRTPRGQPAPADGWTSAVAKGGTYDQVTKNTCAQGGALIAALGEETPHPAYLDLATWSFEAPAGETLVGATLYRATRAHFRSGENAAYEAWLAGPTNNEGFDQCSAISCSEQGELGNPFSPANRVVVPGAQLGAHLYESAACAGPRETFCATGFGDPSGYAVALYIYAGDLVLEQGEGPSVREAGGPLADEQPVSGTSDLTFRATDPASGVYQALFSVDGNLVQATTVDENEGRCRNVGQTTDGLPAFLYVQPCLRSLTADVGFDTTRIPNGTHHLRVSVSDAAGNTTTVLDRDIVVGNVQRAPCNATCDEHALLQPSNPVQLRRPFVRRFGDSNLTLTGRLVSGAGSVADAVIELHQQASYLGARDTLLATTRTDANGTWSLRVPKGPSRLLTVGFRSHSSDAVFASQLQYRETVLAGVRLSAPRHAQPGSPFAFRGYLAGGYIPRGGTLVSLEILYAGQWREIALLRTNARGSFTYRYVFAPIGPATYRFRAQVPQTVGYPFATGASSSRYIHLS